MTSERWHRIEALFDAALAVPAEDRDRFLDEQCATDGSLRHEVAEMLRCDGASETLLRVVQRAATTVVDARDSWEGRRLGPYRILHSIGTGGMGAVFLALRDDDQYRKKVAIKTLRFEASDSFALNRFRHERQVLAGLEHPNIARLLDGGASEHGMPYIVMEYVAGIPITQYCRDKALTIEARLRLFRLVCDAVQYAHQMLVVHRDIKPANILVTADGVPKLVDFGIAKLVDPGATDALPRTMTGLMLMTPAYASPEQVRGEAVSTSTDLYSLGAVLYEVLTGAQAHALGSADAVEIARVVCDGPLLPPSTFGGRRLRGDLDNIVLKAMHKEPARRYPSVGQFSEDLHRYLAGLPVIAQPDSISYRTRKYVRRHWLGVSALTAVLISTTGGATVAVYQARLAQQRFLQVRGLANRFLFDFDDQIRALPGSTAARELLVATALEYLDNLAQDARSDPELQWELAKAYEKVGDVQGSPVRPSLGRTQGALDSYRKALTIEEDLARRGLLDAAKRESLAGAYLELSAIYRTAGTGQEAVDAAERGVEYSRGLSEAAMLRAHATLASSQLFAGEPRLAIETARSVIQAYGGQRQGKPSWSPADDALGGLYLTAGRAAARTAHLEEAAGFFEQAIVLRERRLAEPDLDPLNARDLVLAYHGAGDTLGATDRFNLGRPREAELHYRKALALAERLAATDSNNATARLELARSAGKLGSVLDTVKPDEAILLYQKAQKIAEELLPEGPDRAAMRAAAHSSMAVPLAHLGRIEEARRRFHAAVVIYEAEDARSPRRFTVLDDMADTWLSWARLERQRQPAAAIDYFRKSLAYADQAGELAPRDFAVAFRQNGALEALASALEQGKGSSTGEARALRRRLVDLWKKWDDLQPDSPFIQNRLRQANAAAGESP